jgi:hypothetical protein
MAHFTVTRDVIRRISEIEAPHGNALNEDISNEFPDNADEAYTLAVGFSVATLLTRLRPYSHPAVCECNHPFSVALPDEGPIILFGLPDLALLRREVCNIQCGHVPPSFQQTRHAKSCGRCGKPNVVYGVVLRLSEGCNRGQDRRPHLLGSRGVGPSPRRDVGLADRSASLEGSAGNLGLDRSLHTTPGLARLT